MSTLIRLAIAFSVLWILNVLVGMEMEREGLWLWGRMFDLFLFFDMRNSIAIIFIIIGCMPIVAFLLVIRWLLK